MHISEIGTIQKPVFFDNSGKLDDYIALVSLLTLDKYFVSGIAVTPVYCNAGRSVELMHKIIEMFCRHDIKIAMANPGPVNPYVPYECFNLHALGNCVEVEEPNALFKGISTVDAADFTAQTILSHNEKTIVVATGPATNLVAAIDKYPELLDKIERVLWVAGAFLVDGNVIAPDHDGSAEWNIFWHPHAAEQLLEYGIPISMFPLDTVCQYPVDNYLMYNLEKNEEKQLSDFAYSVLKPCYDKQKTCYIGSVMPSVFLGMPGLFQFESKAIKVELRGTSMGNIYRTSLGNRIRQASCIDEELFYDCLLAQLEQF